MLLRELNESREHRELAPYALKSYFPSIGEMSITAALICCIMVLYRLAITYLPVLSAPSLDSVDKEVS